MTRNLRTLGLVATAVLMVSAVMASAAQAEKYTAAEYPATLSGASAVHSLSFGEKNKFECAKTTFSGELKEASESAKLVPKYSECSMNVLGVKKVADTTSFCLMGLDHTTFIIFTRTTCELGYFHSVTVFNDAAKTEVLCEYEVAPIEGEKITHKNLEGTKGIELSWEIKEIAYELLKGTTKNCGPESGSSTYTGTSVISAKNKLGKEISFDIG
jgi:hypothetical protein